MNKVETFNYLASGKNRKVRQTHQSDGNPIEWKYDLDMYTYNMVSFLGTFNFADAYINNGCRFKEVKELKKFSFGVALRKYIINNIPLDDFKSCVTGEPYCGSIASKDITDEELDGKWTLEGYYE